MQQQQQSGGAETLSYVTGNRQRLGFYAKLMHFYPAARPGDDKPPRILGAFPARDTRLHASSGHFWLLHDSLNRATASLCSEKHLLQATKETAA